MKNWVGAVYKLQTQTYRMRDVIDYFSYMDKKTKEQKRFMLTNNLLEGYNRRFHERAGDRPHVGDFFLLYVKNLHILRIFISKCKEVKFLILTDQLKILHRMIK